ncbi:MAG: aminodeoxychorismate synthase component I [Cycloclasticus sp.]|nr:MAG: aminodeoxychorismate synthase component I [Cycloclasticus sp.]
MTLALEDCGDYTRVAIPFETDLLNCHSFNPQRYPFLLESSLVNNSHNGFDILFAFPGDTIETFDIADKNFFSRFDNAFSITNTSSDIKSPRCIPFTGGWFVFLSYELVGAIENKLAHIHSDENFPVACATRIPVAIVKSHQKRCCWIVCEKGQESLLKDVWNDLQKMPNKQAENEPKVLINEDVSDVFISGVAKIKSYLKEGDTLQVNLSREWKGCVQGRTSYVDVYRSLQRHNPAPFAGLATFRNSVICSSSPERLVSCTDNVVQMRPIAGTRPRHKDADVDQALAEELLKNSKENAEHVMLIDLIRNDLGRICETGTVGVDEKMVLESYAAVHHIVSNVSGKLVPQMTPSDIIKAVFPGGTITGCPKVRCMEIIYELESGPRGAYTGSMGYVNNNGDMDLNILIRTVVMNDDHLNFRTGAGIVSDSIADNELQETRHKAKALLNALNNNER